MIKDRKFRLGIGIGILLGVALTKITPYIIPKAKKGYKKARKLLKDSEFITKIKGGRMHIQGLSQHLNKPHKSDEHITQYFEVPIVVTEEFEEE